MKNSQEEMILRELKAAGSNGLHPTYFIVDLHIFQYTARIHDARKMIGCTCNHDIKCGSIEHIVNKTMPDGTTRFYYFNESEVWEKMRLESIEQRDRPVTSSQLSFL